MIAPAPDWRRTRDRVREIARNAARLAPGVVTAAFGAKMATIAAEADAAELVIREIDRDDNDPIDTERALAEIWQMAGTATLSQVGAIAPIMARALDTLATHDAPATIN